MFFPPHPMGGDSKSRSPPSLSQMGGELKFPPHTFSDGGGFSKIPPHLKVPPHLLPPHRGGGRIFRWGGIMTMGGDYSYSPPTMGCKKSQNEPKNQTIVSYSHIFTFPLHYEGGISILRSISAKSRNPPSFCGGGMMLFPPIVWGGIVTNYNPPPYGELKAPPPRNRP